MAFARAVASANLEASILASTVEMFLGMEYVDEMQDVRDAKSTVRKSILATG